jgi:hypothetical protein
LGVLIEHDLLLVLRRLMYLLRLQLLLLLGVNRLHFLLELLSFRWPTWPRSPWANFLANFSSLLQSEILRVYNFGFGSQNLKFLIVLNVRLIFTSGSLSTKIHIIEIITKFGLYEKDQFSVDSHLRLSPGCLRGN